jgi:hypothetical protein
MLCDLGPRAHSSRRAPTVLRADGAFHASEPPIEVSWRTASDVRALVDELTKSEEELTEETIRARIRAMLATGNLECDDTGRVWAGNGSGKLCAACHAPILPEAVEYEAELRGRALHFHRRCHEIWLEECEPEAEVTH